VIANQNFFLKASAKVQRFFELTKDFAEKFKKMSIGKFK